jgi:poly(A) polymerase
MGVSSPILAVPNPRPVLKLMAALGVLPAALPEGSDPKALDHLDADSPTDAVFRLAALVQKPEAAARAAARLKLSTVERDRLLALLDEDVPSPGADDAALRRAAADTPPATLIGRSALRHPPDAAGRDLRQRLASLSPPLFPLQGRDALALGVSPGPAVGEVLRRVRGWWLERGCLDTAAACREELARVVAASAS